MHKNKIVVLQLYFELSVSGKNYKNMNWYYARPNILHFSVVQTYQLGLALLDCSVPLQS